MTHAWHIATVKPFCEFMAEDWLSSRGFQAFNPKCQVARIQRGQRVIVQRPYIPGYIFVHFDVEADPWERINTGRGLQQVIYSTGTKPAVVATKAMNILLERCVGDLVRDDEIDFALSRIIPPGAKVSFASGAFAGLHGRVKWSAQERVAVVMNFLGTKREITVPTSQVEVVALAGDA